MSSRSMQRQPSIGSLARNSTLAQARVQSREGMRRRSSWSRDGGPGSVTVEHRDHGLGDGSDGSAAEPSEVQYVKGGLLKSNRSLTDVLAEADRARDSSRRLDPAPAAAAGGSGDSAPVDPARKKQIGAVGRVLLAEYVSDSGSDFEPQKREASVPKRRPSKGGPGVRLAIGSDDGHGVAAQAEPLTARSAPPGPESGSRDELESAGEPRGAVSKVNSVGALEYVAVRPGMRGRRFRGDAGAAGASVSGTQLETSPLTGGYAPQKVGKAGARGGGGIDVTPHRPSPRKTPQRQKWLSPEPNAPKRPKRTPRSPSSSDSESTGASSTSGSYTGSSYSSSSQSSDSDDAARRRRRRSSAGASGTTRKGRRRSSVAKQGDKRARRASQRDAAASSTSHPRAPSPITLPKRPDGGPGRPTSRPLPGDAERGAASRAPQRPQRRRSSAASNARRRSSAAAPDAEQEKSKPKHRRRGSNTDSPTPRRRSLVSGASAAQSTLQSHSRRVSNAAADAAASASGGDAEVGEKRTIARAAMDKAAQKLASLEIRLYALQAENVAVGEPRDQATADLEDAFIHLAESEGLHHRWLVAHKSSPYYAKKLKAEMLATFQPRLAEVRAVEAAFARRREAAPRLARGKASQRAAYAVRMARMKLDGIMARCEIMSAGAAWDDEISRVTEAVTTAEALYESIQGSPHSPELVSKFVPAAHKALLLATRTREGIVGKAEERSPDESSVDGDVTDGDSYDLRDAIVADYRAQLSVLRDVLDELTEWEKLGRPRFPQSRLPKLHADLYDVHTDEAIFRTGPNGVARSVEAASSSFVAADTLGGVADSGDPSQNVHRRFAAACTAAVSAVQQAQDAVLSRDVTTFGVVEAARPKLAALREMCARRKSKLSQDDGAAEALASATEALREAESSWAGMADSTTRPGIALTYLKAARLCQLKLLEAMEAIHKARAWHAPTPQSVVGRRRSEMHNRSELEDEDDDENEEASRGIGSRAEDADAGELEADAEMTRELEALHDRLQNLEDRFTKQGKPGGAVGNALRRARNSVSACDAIWGMLTRSSSSDAAIAEDLKQQLAQAAEAIRAAVESMDKRDVDVERSRRLNLANSTLGAVSRLERASDRLAALSLRNNAAGAPPDRATELLYSAAELEVKADAHLRTMRANPEELSIKETFFAMLGQLETAISSADHAILERGDAGIVEEEEEADEGEGDKIDDERGAEPVEDERFEYTDADRLRTSAPSASDQDKSAVAEPISVVTEAGETTELFASAKLNIYDTPDALAARESKKKQRSPAQRAVSPVDVVESDEEAVGGGAAVAAHDDAKSVSSESYTTDSMTSGSTSSVSTGSSSADSIGSDSSSEGADWRVRVEQLESELAAVTAAVKATSAANRDAGEPLDDATVLLRQAEQQVQGARRALEASRTKKSCGSDVQNKVKTAIATANSAGEAVAARAHDALATEAAEAESMLGDLALAVDELVEQLATIEANTPSSVESDLYAHVASRTTEVKAALSSLSDDVSAAQRRKGELYGKLRAIVVSDVTAPDVKKFVEQVETCAAAERDLRDSFASLRDSHAAIALCDTLDSLVAELTRLHEMAKEDAAGSKPDEVEFARQIDVADSAVEQATAARRALERNAGDSGARMALATAVGEFEAAIEKLRALKASTAAKDATPGSKRSRSSLTSGAAASSPGPDDEMPTSTSITGDGEGRVSDTSLGVDSVVSASDVSDSTNAPSDGADAAEAAKPVRTQSVVREYKESLRRLRSAQRVLYDVDPDGSIPTMDALDAAAGKITSLETLRKLSRQHMQTFGKSPGRTARTPGRSPSASGLVRTESARIARLNMTDALPAATSALQHARDALERQAQHVLNGARDRLAAAHKQFGPAAARCAEVLAKLKSAGGGEESSAQLAGLLEEAEEALGDADRREALVEDDLRAGEASYAKDGTGIAPIVNVAGALASSVKTAESVVNALVARLRELKDAESRERFAAVAEQTADARGELAALKVQLASLGAQLDRTIGLDTSFGGGDSRATGEAAACLKTAEAAVDHAFEQQRVIDDLSNASKGAIDGGDTGVDALAAQEEFVDRVEVAAEKLLRAAEVVKQREADAERRSQLHSALAAATSGVAASEKTLRQLSKRREDILEAERRRLERPEELTVVVREFKQAFEAAYDARDRAGDAQRAFQSAVLFDASLAEAFVAAASALTTAVQEADAHAKECERVLHVDESDAAPKADESGAAAAGDDEDDAKLAEARSKLAELHVRFNELSATPPASPAAQSASEVASAALVAADTLVTLTGSGAKDTKSRAIVTRQLVDCVARAEAAVDAAAKAMGSARDGTESSGSESVSGGEALAAARTPSERAKSRRASRRERRASLRRFTLGLPKDASQVKADRARAVAALSQLTGAISRWNTVCQRTRQVRTARDGPSPSFSGGGSPASSTYFAGSATLIMPSPASRDAFSPAARDGPVIPEPFLSHEALRRDPDVPQLCEAVAATLPPALLMRDLVSEAEAGAPGTTTPAHRSDAGRLHATEAPRGSPMGSTARPPKSGSRVQLFASLPASEMRKMTLSPRALPARIPEAGEDNSSGDDDDASRARGGAGQDPQARPGSVDRTGVSPRGRSRSVVSITSPAVGAATPTSATCSSAHRGHRVRLVPTHMIDQFEALASTAVAAVNKAASLLESLLGQHEALKAIKRAQQRALGNKIDSLDVVLQMVKTQGLTGYDKELQAAQTSRDAAVAQMADFNPATAHQTALLDLMGAVGRYQAPVRTLEMAAKDARTEKPKGEMGLRVWLYQLASSMLKGSKHQLPEITAQLDAALESCSGMENAPLVIAAEAESLIVLAEASLREGSARFATIMAESIALRDLVSLVGLAYEVRWVMLLTRDLIRVYLALASGSREQIQTALLSSEAETEQSKSKQKSARVRLDMIRERLRRAVKSFRATSGSHPPLRLIEFEAKEATAAQAVEAACAAAERYNTAHEKHNSHVMRWSAAVVSGGGSAAAAAGVSAASAAAVTAAVKNLSYCVAIADIAVGEVESLLVPKLQRRPSGIASPTASPMAASGGAGGAGGDVPVSAADPLYAGRTGLRRYHRRAVIGGGSSSTAAAVVDFQPVRRPREPQLLASVVALPVDYSARTGLRHASTEEGLDRRTAEVEYVGYIARLKEVGALYRLLVDRISRTNMSKLPVEIGRPLQAVIAETTATMRDADINLPPVSIGLKGTISSKRMAEFESIVRRAWITVLRFNNALDNAVEKLEADKAEQERKRLARVATAAKAAKDMQRHRERRSRRHHSGESHRSRRGGDRDDRRHRRRSSADSDDEHGSSRLSRRESGGSRRSTHSRRHDDDYRYDEDDGSDGNRRRSRRRVERMRRHDSDRSRRSTRSHASEVSRTSRRSRRSDAGVDDRRDRRRHDRDRRRSHSHDSYSDDDRSRRRERRSPRSSDGDESEDDGRRRRARRRSDRHDDRDRRHRRHSHEGSSDEHSSDWSDASSVHAPDGADTRWQEAGVHPRHLAKRYRSNESHRSRGGYKRSMERSMSRSASRSMSRSASKSMNRTRSSRHELRSHRSSASSKHKRSSSSLKRGMSKKHSKARLSELERHATRRKRPGGGGGLQAIKSGQAEDFAEAKAAGGMLSRVFSNMFTVNPEVSRQRAALRAVSFRAAEARRDEEISEEVRREKREIAKR